jgi:hypothetical protein
MAPEVRVTALYEQLVEHSVACNLPADATPFQRFRSMWELYKFLDKHEPLDLCLSLTYALNNIEPGLTEADKTVMRTLDCSFPEDWDTPLDFVNEE